MKHVIENSEKKLFFSGKDLENIVWENQEYLKTQYSGDNWQGGVSIPGFLDMWHDFENCEDKHLFKKNYHIGPSNSSDVWSRLPNLIGRLCKSR